MKKFLMGVAVSTVVLLNAGVSSAAIVNYSGSDIDMGTVSVGDTGFIYVDSTSGLILSRVSGMLPSNSMITFSYDFAGSLLSGMLASGAEYEYTDGGVNYYGNAISVMPGDTTSYATVDGSVSSSLVLASSQVDFINDAATATITSNASALAQFQAIFAGLVIGDDTLEISYSVSAVPLPAALPLFGAGLGALAGFGAWRKRKAAA